jgi:putative transposase
MPRRARLSVPGIPWHIIQRGNNRSACFHADDDYQFYLHWLKQFADKFDCAVHAYVLMTNHVHLLLTPARQDSAGLMMKHLGQRYVQYVNRVYRRTGTLWERRFRSCLAQSEIYVLACYRYIELNPVRAGMVERPQDYRWSSYHANGQGQHSELLIPHEQYRGLGGTDAERREAYRALLRAHVEEPLTDEIRAATNGNFVLGDKRFQAQIAQALGRRVTRAKAGRPAKQGDPSGTEQSAPL